MTNEPKEGNLTAWGAARGELRRARSLLNEAFLVVVVGPSVITAFALLVASGGSPAELASTWFQAQAQAAALPRARDGFLTVQECPFESVGGIISDCSSPVTQEVSIAELSERAGDVIMRIWVLFALSTAGFRWMFAMGPWSRLFQGRASNE